MIAGYRVTDEVSFFRRRGELRRAVRAVRRREPERLRWRVAVSNVNQTAGQLVGRDRMLVEEPVREMILDLDDRALRREVVIDARRFGVDLDRGEVLAYHNVWDVRRIAYLTGIDLQQLVQHVSLPDHDTAPIDTGAVILVGRAISEMHRRRAHQLMQRVPQRAEGILMPHEQSLLERAQQASDLARRWAAMAQTIAKDSR